LDSANYIGVGPVFASSTKQFEQLAGLDFVRQVAAEIQLPAFAIGGINVYNLASVVESGLSRIAVQDCVINSNDIALTVSKLRQALENEQSPSSRA